MSLQGSKHPTLTYLANPILLQFLAYGKPTYPDQSGILLDPRVFCWVLSSTEAAEVTALLRPIIHRDLKPLNLLLSKDLQVGRREYEP